MNQNLNIAVGLPASVEYEHLLVAAYNSPTPLPVPVASHARAVALRQRIYTYFKQLRAASPREDLRMMAGALTIAIEPQADGTAHLVLSNRAEAWDTTAIRDALGLAVATPAPRARPLVGSKREALLKMREEAAKAQKP